MRYRWLKILLPCLLLLMATLPLPVDAQGNRSAPNSLYSIWVRLSLRGYHQAEIESLLRNMDPKTLEEVKTQLRQTVLANLEMGKIKASYLASRDSDDLHNIRSAIETEIRFAGLETDRKLRDMIEDRFGIPLTRF
ncbi:MAG: hypothetical protein OEW39_10310 [Deltaproteobacteria bacterium]|nr:hypothetical protein [Deltaproteobacteria bacterium]